MPVAAAALLLLFFAQQPLVVAGRVTDGTGLALLGATLTLKETGRFVVTDESGEFSIAVPDGRAVLVIALPGFVTQERTVPLSGDSMAVVLSVAGVSMDVTVTAPSVDPVTNAPPITAIDVVRTPGAQADLMRALSRMAGVANVDEAAGLFVRGGDVSEVRVLLDGVVVNHPYRYETPTGGFRGAVDAFQTSGTVFTTGGFSAATGNALSAVVGMSSLGRASAPQMNVTAGLAGVSLSAAAPLGRRAGARLAVNRTTPSLLFAVNPQPQEFDRLPGGWDASGGVQFESTRLGAIRVLGLAQRDHVGVELEKDAFIGFLHSGTRHDLIAAKWERRAGPSWVVTASAGGDRFVKATDVGVLAVDEGETHRSGRAELLRTASGWQVRLGADGEVIDTTIAGEVPARDGDFDGVSGRSTFSVDRRDWTAGAFVVVSRPGRVAPEIGLRQQRFDGAGTWTTDPRLAVAVRLGTQSRVRISWGRYHQGPSPGYFDAERGASRLAPMTATHTIVGYERGDPSERAYLRLEAYSKSYSQLPLEAGMAGFSSSGFGSARGVDLFARKTWSWLDVSLTASLLDATRRWTPPDQRDRYPLPPGEWRPDFAIPFSWQVTASRTISRALSIAAAWRVAAGRPFTPVIGAEPSPEGYVPIWGPINSERLPRYERLDISASVVKAIGARASAVFFASVDNVIGRQNFFEYAYSNDYSARRPVRSASPRAFYVGCSFTR
jgi:vitamin B12 transporter